MKRKNTIAFVALMLSAGCATDSSIQRLKQDNSVLSAQLNTANNDIERLSREKTDLQQEMDYLSEVKRALAREKEARITQSRSTISEVQSFVRSQAKALSEFSLSEDILDYSGGELIDRSTLSGEDQLLADLKHPVAVNGSIIGGRVFARTAGSVAFCILRPVSSGYMVVWKSKDFMVSGTGGERLSFGTMISVEAGDIPAIYCSGAVPVPFDEGTGETGIRSGTVKSNMMVPSEDLIRTGNRTYSFGIEGLME